MSRPNFDIGLFEHPEQPVGFSDRKKLSENKSTPHFRELMRLEIPPKVDTPTAVAKQFVAAEKSPQERTIMHSRIQNRLIRHRFTGSTSLNARDVIREASILLPGKNFSQDVDRMFVGVDSAIRAILADQQSFQQTHQENELQRFYFDDVLDAHHAIDYIDVRMEQKDDGSVEVKEIRFVQVKTRDISDDERSKILLDHKKYLAQLSSKSDVVRSERTRVVEHIRSGKFFEFDSKDKTRKDIDIADRIFQDFFGVVDDILSSPQPVSDERVKIWIEMFGFTKADFFVFASLLTGDVSTSSIAKKITDMYGMDLSQQKLLQESMLMWLEEVDLDSIHLPSLAPLVSVKKILSKADFVSVIHHGNQVEEIPLTIGSDKAIHLIPRIAS